MTSFPCWWASSPLHHGEVTDVVPGDDGVCPSRGLLLCGGLIRRWHRHPAGRQTTRRSYFPCKRKNWHPPPPPPQDTWLDPRLQREKKSYGPEEKSQACALKPIMVRSWPVMTHPPAQSFPPPNVSYSDPKISFHKRCGCKQHLKMSRQGSARLHSPLPCRAVFPMYAHLWPPIWSPPPVSSWGAMECT